MDESVPVLVLDESTVPVEHHTEAFHDGLQLLFDATPVGPNDEFHVRSRDHHVGDVVVSQLSTDPLTARRGPRQLRDGTTDWFNVHLYQQGSLLGEAARGTGLDVRGDQIGFLDFAAPFSTVMPRSESTWIAVPRDRVVHAEALGPAGTLPRTSVRGRVLEAAIADLCRQLHQPSGLDPEQLAGQLVDAINAALDPDRHAPTDHDLALAMKDFLRVNLGDLDLGVDALRATFHCSRASVYRCFEGEGGVAAFIREQRLLRCFEAISRPRERPGRISAIASTWGFENPSHFHRLFTARFGLPPSELRAAATADERVGHSGGVGWTEHPDTAEWIRTSRAWTVSS